MTIITAKEAKESSIKNFSKKRELEEVMTRIKESIDEGEFDLIVNQDEYPCDVLVRLEQLGYNISTLIGDFEDKTLISWN